MQPMHVLVGVLGAGAIFLVWQIMRRSAFRNAVFRYLANPPRIGVNDGVRFVGVRSISLNSRVTGLDISIAFVMTESPTTTDLATLESLVGRRKRGRNIADEPADEFLFTFDSSLGLKAFEQFEEFAAQCFRNASAASSDDSGLKLKTGDGATPAYL